MVYRNVVQRLVWISVVIQPLLKQRRSVLPDVVDPGSLVSDMDIVVLVCLVQGLVPVRVCRGYERIRPVRLDVIRQSMWLMIVVMGKILSPSCSTT